MPALGIRFIPLDCTIVVLAGSKLVHGTAPISSISEDIMRVGSSHFLRVPDLTDLVYLNAAVGGRAKMLALQRDILAEIGSQKTVAAKQTALKAAKKKRSGLIEEGKKTTRKAVTGQLMFWTEWSGSQKRKQQ